MEYPFVSEALGDSSGIKMVQQRQRIFACRLDHGFEFRTIQGSSLLDGLSNPSFRLANPLEMKDDILADPDDFARLAEIIQQRFHLSPGPS